MIIDRFKRPLRDLRISLTDKCNFRCIYCMPASIFNGNYQFLRNKDLLSVEQLELVAQASISLGVRKIRLTGGEPLLRPDLIDIVERLGQLDNLDDLAMITNGIFLPQKAQALCDAGLHRLTISLDTLDEAVFQRMNGHRGQVANVLRGIEAAEKAGFMPIKINTVVKRGVNDHDIVNIARHFKDHGHIVRFIEYMDVGSANNWCLDDVVPAQEIIERIDASMPLEPVGGNYYGEVAQRYRYRDGSGEIGVVASVTYPFCHNCTRLRLSANGKLYTCLFANHGYDIKTHLDQNMTVNELTEIIHHRIWKPRQDKYSQVRTSNTEQKQKIEMHYIGG